MPQIAKVVINWTGFPGGPGYTNLYFSDTTGSGALDQDLVDSAASQAQNWIAAWRPRLPTSVFTGIDPTVEAIESTTGAVQAFWTATVAAPVAGGGVASFSGPSGACVSWYTSTVRKNRRIRGRTFVVPLDTASYEADGTLIPTIPGVIIPASQALISSSGPAHLGIWCRPTTKGGTDGQWARATSFRMQDKAAILTSRRQ